MNNRSLNSVSLERTLIVSLLVMIGLAIFGFSSLHGVLQQSALGTNHAQIDAALGRETIDQLRYLDTYVERNQTTIDRTASIVAESKQYSYQNQIVADVNTYASRAGVGVLGYNFSTTEQKGSRAVAGLKTINVTVTLASPIEYVAFLRFLKAIEQNLTKMQIAGISISPDPVDRRKISNPTIGLEVYVK